MGGSRSSRSRPTELRLISSFSAMSVFVRHPDRRADALLPSSAPDTSFLFESGEDSRLVVNHVGPQEPAQFSTGVRCSFFTRRRQPGCMWVSSQMSYWHQDDFPSTDIHRRIARWTDVVGPWVEARSMAGRRPQSYTTWRFRMNRLVLGTVVLVIGLISVTAVAYTDVAEWIFGPSEASDETTDGIPSVAGGEPESVPPSQAEGESSTPEELGNNAGAPAVDVTGTSETPSTPPADGATSESGEPQLMVSLSPERAEPVALEGTTVSGLIYVFVVSAEAERVEFWLDDPNRSTVPMQTERHAPFDLAGGEVNRANPLDVLALGEGRHYVSARVTKADGSTSLVTASFQVGTEAPTPSSTVTTSEDDGTGAKTGPETTPANTTTTAVSKASTTTTTRPKPTTTTTTTGSAKKRSGDVRLKPGDAVAAIVAKSSNGTVFVFSPGVYKRLSIQPKAGQKFLGEAGAVLDGKGAEFAFRSNKPNVTIDGLEITGYRPEPREGVIDGIRDWVVSNNEIHHTLRWG